MFGMLVIYWNMLVCFWPKSVICYSKYLRTYDLCWLLLISIWNLYKRLLMYGMLCWMCVRLCVGTLVLRISDLEDLLSLKNEYKLEYFELEY